MVSLEFHISEDAIGDFCTHIIMDVTIQYLPKSSWKVKGDLIEIIISRDRTKIFTFKVPKNKMPLLF